jgi:hypothetical protein
MPSTSYHEWEATRSSSLDELARAHVAVGGTKRGRRYATQQINRSYAVLLASQFQGFCRDLHTECAASLVKSISPTSLQPIVRVALTQPRQLDRGNAQAASIGSDFGKLGIDFWAEIEALDARNHDRKKALGELNKWRDAIVHQSFEPAEFGNRPMLGLAEGRRWRADCGQLARSFDEVMRTYLQSLTGIPPW